MPPGRAEVAVLETPRLRLRLLDGGDEALYCDLYTDPEVMREILPPLAPERAARAFVHARAHNGKVVPGHRFWAIDEKAGAGAIGIAALLRAGDSAELGVMLRPGWWNRGVSSEAFAPLLDHAFLGMRLALVHAERPDDAHARVIDRLLDRFGFVRTPERASRPGQCRWELPRQAWAARRHA